MKSKLISLSVLTLALLLSSPNAFGLAHWEGYCQRGGQKVVTNSVQSTTSVQQSYPQATLTVYITGALTPTLATIYSDNNSTPLANPTTCSTTGYFSFYAFNNTLDLAFSGVGVPSPFTWGAVQGIDPLYPLPVTGTQLQYLRLKPNTGDNTTLQFASLISVNSNDYNFPAQTCVTGCTINAGSPSTITVAPVPLGVNGANTSYNVYISGGTGTAEYCPVSGGSAVAGSASGTLTITCIHAHSGAWSVQSDSAGIAEASQATAGNTEILTPAGFIAINGPFTLIGAGQSLVGQGSYGTVLLRQYSDSTDMVSLTGGTNLRNMGFGSNTGGLITGGMIFVTGSDSVLYNLRLIDASTSTCSARFITVSAAARILIDYINAGEATTYGVYWTGSSGGTMTNINIGSTATNMVAIYEESGSLNGSVWNLQTQGSNSITFAMSPQSGHQVSEQIIDNVTLDSAHQAGLYAIAGSGTIGGVTLSNFRISVFGSPVIVSGVVDLTLNGFDVAVVTNNSGAGQIRVISGTNVQIRNSQIINGGGITGYNGIIASEGGATVAGLQIENSVVCKILVNGILDTGCGFGIFVGAGATNYLQITGNDLGGTTPLSDSSTGIRKVISKNLGVDNLIPTVTSASTLALPVNPNFILNGGTGVTAVTTFSAAGMTWNFTVGTSTTFTAGATIGVTTTITSWGTAYWDGTKLWITSGDGTFVTTGTPQTITATKTFNSSSSNAIVAATTSAGNVAVSAAGNATGSYGVLANAITQAYPLGISGHPFSFVSGSCGALVAGAVAVVTDSNTNTWGATIAAGGANIVLAFCDGTNWTVAAK